MPKYTITGQITVSAWTVVEASTPEEALQIAEDRAEDPKWYSYDTGTDPEEEFCCDSLDGSVLNLEVEE